MTSTVSYERERLAAEAADLAEVSREDRLRADLYARLPRYGLRVTETTGGDAGTDYKVELDGGWPGTDEGRAEVVVDAFAESLDRSGVVEAFDRRTGRVLARYEDGAPCDGWRAPPPEGRPSEPCPPTLRSESAT
jgi:hypothetical protein